jgi:hypothetical protein
MLYCLPFLLLLAFFATSSASISSFQWPNANIYWRVLVNVNQYIEKYPKEWFSRDKVVTDLSVVNVSPGAMGLAADRYRRVRDLLESHGMYVGTYISGTTVGPAADQTVYPAGSVPIEHMPPSARYVGSWPGQPGRRIIDVESDVTRQALQAGIRQLWEATPAPLRFVDNAAAHSSTGGKQPWAGYCKNMEGIRQVAESLGSRVIFNISMHPGMLTDDEALQLTQAVGAGNGIALETPWSPAIRQNTEATAKAEMRYRQLLDSGLTVIMIPTDVAEDQLAAWVNTWRKSTDHIYFSGIFWKPPEAIKIAAK